MTNKVIKQLAEKKIYSYGSNEILKFEKQLEKYFEREYARWEGNDDLPEAYGVSSFDGIIAKEVSHSETIEHYNNEFNIYRSFLDKQYMAYTMAYYDATDNEPIINSQLSLSQAQTQKYQLLADRADIKDGQTILDLGCGFGGFIQYLLEHYPNINIVGVNPSIVQCQFIRNNLSSHSARFKLISKFIGEITNDDIPANSLDRIVSIGALEHFSNFDLLFKQLETILKPGGKCLHHIIVSADTIPQFLNAEKTLMSDYFPGGHIWPYNELRRHSTHLKFTNSWFVNGLNYWKTLDEWHRQFWENIEQSYPKYMSIDEVEKWNKYFSLCKTMFRPNNGQSYGNGHYLYEKV